LPADWKSGARADVYGQIQKTPTEKARLFKGCRNRIRKKYSLGRPDGQEKGREKGGNNDVGPGKFGQLDKRKN